MNTKIVDPQLPFVVFFSSVGNRDRQILLEIEAKSLYSSCVACTVVVLRFLLLSDLYCRCVAYTIVMWPILSLCGL